jgi:hypothetical protein
MRFDDEIVIDVSIEDVWRVYADVERWPEWTASVRTCRYVAGDTLALGSQVRIEQPKLRPAVWEVTGLDPGRSWSWAAKAPGARTTAVHTLEPLGAGSTRVHQTIEQRGVLAPLVGRLYGRLIREYLTLEAEGLKARSEASAAA